MVLKIYIYISINIKCNLFNCLQLNSYSTVYFCAKTQQSQNM